MVTPSSVSPLPLQQDKNRDLETACLAIIFAIWNNGWRAWRGKELDCLEHWTEKR
jgi:hypothetical protein